MSDAVATNVDFRGHFQLEGSGVFGFELVEDAFDVLQGVGGSELLGEVLRGATWKFP